MTFKPNKIEKNNQLDNIGLKFDPCKQAEKDESWWVPNSQIRKRLNVFGVGS